MCITIYDPAYELKGGATDIKKDREQNATKNAKALLNRRVITIVTLTLLVLFFLSIPALATVYRYTGTHFKYIGDVFHQKVVEFDNGRAGFQVSGEGTVSGSHIVTTVRYDDAPVDGVYREAAELSLNLYGTTSPNAAADKKLRMISGLEVNISAKTEIVTGVEMDPGESGYIKQTVSTSSNPEGEYLKVNNNFGNTGGTTVRDMEVKGFISDTMRVEGYAEVWETTTVRDGNASAGWWKTLP